MTDDVVPGIPEWVLFTRREVNDMLRWAKQISESSMERHDPARAAVVLLQKQLAWAVGRQVRRNEDERG